MKEQDYEKYMDKIEQGVNMVQGLLKLERQFGFFKANFVEKEKKSSEAVKGLSDDN